MMDQAKTQGLDLRNADALHLTSTSASLSFIAEISGRAVGPVQIEPLASMFGLNAIMAWVEDEFSAIRNHESLDDALMAMGLPRSA